MSVGSGDRSGAASNARGAVARQRNRVASVAAPRRLVTIAPAAFVALLGTTGLVAWLSGRLVLTSGNQRFIPMAPATAIAFLLLSGALLAQSLGKGRRIAAAVSALVGVFGAARLAVAVEPSLLPDLEALLVRNPGVFGAVPLARISPVTAAGLTALGVSVALAAITDERSRARDCAAIVGATTALLGSVVVLGYVYGTPLLYGGSTIPVALPTGVGLAAAGVATVIAAGLDAWPLRLFIGPTTRARLLRTFLPATTAAFVVAGAGAHALVTHFQANRALAAAVSALAAVAFVTLLVVWMARSVGGQIDSAEQALRMSQEELERRVVIRTEELTRANEELKAFSYSVSHDLRAPLRHISGFAALLERSAAGGLAAQERRYVRTIVEAAERMSRLIDDLLSFSRVGRTELQRAQVNLDTLVDEVIADEAARAPDRLIAWKRQPLATVEGDRAMLRVALQNLIGNAVKYTGTRERAEIEVDAIPSTNGEAVVYVRDNGVGFEMQYAAKLFGVFQRLHDAEDFDGTGIGLANVRRVVQRHGGRTWAHGVVDRGATFYIALPLTREGR